MGAIEFAKNKTNNREKLFLAKNTETHGFIFVRFLQINCLSTPREVSASSTKIKHTTQKQTTHTHTHL